jgi:hypothetical protein
VTAGELADEPALAVVERRAASILAAASVGATPAATLRGSG